MHFTSRAAIFAGTFFAGMTAIAAGPSFAEMSDAIIASPSSDPVLATETRDADVLATEPAGGAQPLADVGDLPAAPSDLPALRGETLIEMVAAARDATPRSREERCLATGIYFEAKSEPLEGQLAVARVIINRAESGRFPSTYCGVLTQRSQFSFIRGGILPATPRNSIAWQNAVAIARIAEQEAWKTPAEGALFFHARRVAPGWKLVRMTTVGNHVFYR